MKCIKNLKIIWEEIKPAAMKQICHGKKTAERCLQRCCKISVVWKSAKKFEERLRTLSITWFDNLSWVEWRNHQRGVWRWTNQEGILLTSQASDPSISWKY